MRTYPAMPGVPAAGHISCGFWHPGQADGCAKCPENDSNWLRRRLADPTLPPPPTAEQRRARRGR